MNSPHPTPPRTVLLQKVRAALTALPVAILLAMLTTATALAHDGSHAVPVGGSTLITLPLTLLAVAGLLAAAGYFMYTAHRERDLPLPTDEAPIDPTP